MSPRVLVIDDLPEIRALVRRTLRDYGYVVDGAATLAEARQLDPAGYDAVLVDSRLGAEHGADLIEALREHDPAAAGHCVIMTGGTGEGLPAGVACLAKPFRVDDLLAAVRTAARLAPAPAPAPPQPSAPAGTPAQPAPEPGAPAARRILRLLRLLREHEHSSLGDYLHDGPIQELTAAFLELQLIRRSADPDLRTRVTSVLDELESALTALRSLMDGSWPPALAGEPVSSAIRRRTAWLLAAPAEVSADAPGPGPDETAIAADASDLAEVMLLAMQPAAPAATAHITVRTRERPAQVILTLTPGRDSEAVGDQVTAQAALRELAGTLGGSLQADFFSRQWQVRLALTEAPGAGTGPVL